MALSGFNPGASQELDASPLSFSGRSDRSMYLAHAFFNLNRFNFVISTMSGVGDHRIVPMARQIIISTLNDKRRKNLLEVLRKDLMVIQRSTLNAEEQAELRIEICQLAIAEVYSYLDEEFTISTADVVAPLISEPNEKEMVETDLDEVEPGADEAIVLTTEIDEIEEDSEVKIKSGLSNLDLESDSKDIGEEDETIDRFF